MSAPPTVADVLDAAAKLIEPKGAWRQNSWGDHGCFCAEGAIFEVAENAGEAHRAIAHLETVLPEPLDPELRVVPNWNDAPGRTQAEVVAKLREAAAKAREQGK